MKIEQDEAIWTFADQLNALLPVQFSHSNCSIYLNKEGQARYVRVHSLLTVYFSLTTRAKQKDTLKNLANSRAKNPYSTLLHVEGQKECDDGRSLVQNKSLTVSTLVSISVEVLWVI